MNLIAQPVANTDSPASANSAASAAGSARPTATSTTGRTSPPAKKQPRQAAKISSVRVATPSLTSALKYRRQVQDRVAAKTTSANAIGLATSSSAGSTAASSRNKPPPSANPVAMMKAMTRGVRQ